MAELKVVKLHEMNDIKLGLRNDKLYFKSEADKVIAELEENHKKEVDRLLMKIAGLEKLVETADKLLKPKGGFMVKDITFNGVKLEGVKNEP